MAKYNNNWNNQPRYDTQNTVRKIHLNEPKNSESQLSYEPLAYGVSDKLGGWLGIDKAAKKAAEQVISQMGNDLKAEAREAAKETAKAEVNKKAQEIEKNILKSVNENATKAAKDAAEKAVKNVGPEVANLLKPEIKTQVEEAVKKYSEEKIESLIKPEITNKIDDLLTERSKEARELLKNKMNELIEDAHKNLNGKINKIECELTEAKSHILEIGANSLHESAKLLSLMAENETCANQDLVYF